MDRRIRWIVTGIAVILLSFAVFVPSAGAQPCSGSSWVVRAPVPYNARGIFSASDGTFLYGGGGYDGTNVHADLERYDPATNSWSPLAPSPDQHFLSPAVYSPVTNKIYNFGGFDGAGADTNTTRIYDVASNTWSTGAPMPAVLTDEAAVYYNGIVYVAGGVTGISALNTLYAYNIAANSWSTLAPMPQALYLPGFGAINGKVYIASGNNGVSELTTLYIYDIASNTWSTGAPVPLGVTGPGSTVFQGSLFLYGGGFPTTRANTQIYDPVSNTWSPGPNLNVNRLWFYGAAVGNSIVAPGGDTFPGIPVNANEELTCAAPGVTLTDLSPAKLWVGLRNSDDQGTQFDVKVEVLKNGTPVASGLQRCITGLTRNPSLARETNVAFDPFADVTFGSGDVLALRVSTRIGTNPDGTKCAGPGDSHNNAVGLRLYYDATNRASHFDATISPNPSEDMYLHSDGAVCPNGDGDSPGVINRFLDDIPPTAATAKCKNSGSVNFNGGNPFSLVGTWSLAAFP